MSFYFLHSSPQPVSFFLCSTLFFIILFFICYLHLFIFVCLATFYRFRTSVYSLSYIQHFSISFVTNNLLMRVNILYDVRRKRSLTSIDLSIIKTCTPFKSQAKGRSVKRHRNAVLKWLSPSFVHLWFQIFLASVPEDSLLCSMKTLHCLELRYSIAHWRSF
jgi:hypothetical protein